MSDTAPTDDDVAAAERGLRDMIARSTSFPLVSKGDFFFIYATSREDPERALVMRAVCAPGVA